MTFDNIVTGLMLMGLAWVDRQPPPTQVNLTCWRLRMGVPAQRMRGSWTVCGSCDDTHYEHRALEGVVPHGKPKACLQRGAGLGLRGCGAMW
jgi:hypothetical protein